MLINLQHQRLERLKMQTNKHQKQKIMRTITFVFALVLLMFNTNLLAQSAQFVKDSNLLIQFLSGERTASGAEIISQLQEGVAITRLNGRYGMVNAQGYEIISPRFQDIHPFQNGYAAAKKNGKWGFINKQGQKLSSFRYDWVGNFENGYAPVNKNGKWGFINEQGVELNSVQFDTVRPFKNGKALVKKKGNWYFINEKGALSHLNGIRQV